MGDAIRRAAAMGKSAGERARTTGVPQRMPFNAPRKPSTPRLLRECGAAWDKAYVEAAYASGQIHPTGKPIGLPDAAGDTTGMTAAAISRDTRLYGEGFAALADEAIVAPPTGNTGACLMAFMADADAQRIAQTDGEPPTEMHVTLAYLSQPAAEYSPEQRATYEAALANVAVKLPIQADGFAVAHFNPDDEDREPCLTLLVQSDALAQIHDATTTATADSQLALDTKFPIWVPHVTIGYNLDPAAIDSAAVTGSVSFDRLIMAWGDEKHTITSNPEEPVTQTAPADTLAIDTDGELAAVGGDTPDPNTPPLPAADPEPAAPAGPTWQGPLALVGTPSSDGRQLGVGGATIRPLPQPLNWQEQSDDAHKGSYVVGRILAVEERGGQLWGSGDYLDPMENEAVRKAMAQVDAGLGLISLDTAPQVISFLDKTSGQPVDPTWEMDPDNIIVQFTAYEVGGATIVNFPAFADARITNDQPEQVEEIIEGGPIMMPGEMPGAFAGANVEAPMISDDGTSITLTDGSTVGVGDTVGVTDQDPEGGIDSATITAIDPDAQTVTVQIIPDDDGDTEPMDPITLPVADLVPGAPDQRPDTETAPAPPGSMANEDDALLASSFTEPYTAAFFAKRELLGPTPLHIDEETGEVFGHIATWGECHVGKLAQTGACVTAPQGDDFSYFHLTPIKTDDGLIDVGRLTVGTGHYDNPRGGFRGAAHHYDHTGHQVALVCGYEDTYGVQVTGQLIHGIAPARVDELRRSPISGDWRGRPGHLKLTAALAVNVPGFPVRRLSPQIGLVGGEQVSLVAAGIVYPEENTTVTLPSGMQIDRGDWDSMVAAAMEAISRNTTTISVDGRKLAAAVPAAAQLGEADQVAFRQARAKLALRARRR